MILPRLETRRGNGQCLSRPNLLKINSLDNLPEKLLKLLLKLVEGEARASEQVTGENLELAGFRPGSRVLVMWL